MATADQRDGLPRLAYVYHPLSFPPFLITDAAAGLCSITWIIDSSLPGMATLSRLVHRLGPVIDRAGATLKEVAAEVRASRPDGVLSMHDADLVWTAELAQSLGLPFLSVDSATKLTDKHAQRLALAQAGLAVPPCVVLTHDEDEAAIAEAAEAFSYPAVLKPRWGQASRDTLPVFAAAQVRRILTEVRARPDPVGEDYVLEGFIPDPGRPLAGEGFAAMVSVESVVEAGRIEHVSISSRTPLRWPFRETGFCTPTAITPEVQADLHRVATDAARAMGVSMGCLHTEIKLTDDGPVVIEVNGRPGGGKSEMLQRASGFSILASALRLAVSIPVNVTGPVPCARVGYQLYVFPESEFEFIDRVDGIEELRRREGVDEVILRRGPGQRIDWREGSQAHVLNFAGTVESVEALRELMAELPSIIRIEGHNSPDWVPPGG